MDFIADAILHKKDFFNENIINFIRDQFKDDCSDILKILLKRFFDKFIDDLWIYIEYPYVDKLYRSSFYEYYSSKHKPYNRNCFRISLFDQPIIHEDFFNKDSNSKLQESFLGYIIIRPTIPQLIGRNILSPRILKNQDFDCCLTKDEVLIKGVKLYVYGFPHESQDAEFSTCAETSIWSLVEYYSHKYPEYKSILLSDIAKILNNDAVERITPSQGLSHLQVSRVLKQLGFNPKIYYSPDPNNIKKTLYTYIDSGIPIIGGLEFKDENIGHAIVIIGKSIIDLNEIENKLKSLPLRYYNIYDLIDNCSIVTIDDNIPPYNIVSCNNPTENYTKSSSITEIIAPLYPKMHLEASQALSVIDYFLNNTIKNLEAEVFDNNNLNKSVIYKLLLSSSRSFKSYLSQLECINNDIKSLIIGLSMPKFIWVAEISDIELLKEDKINGFIIIDATASTIQVYPTDESSFLCIMINGKLTVNCGKEWTDYSKSVILPSYKNNLKGKWNGWKL